jgi:hypothetical protein
MSEFCPERSNTMCVPSAVTSNSQRSLVVQLGKGTRRPHGEVRQPEIERLSVWQIDEPLAVRGEAVAAAETHCERLAGNSAGQAPGGAVRGDGQQRHVTARGRAAVHDQGVVGRPHGVDGGPRDQARVNGRFRDVQRVPPECVEEGRRVSSGRPCGARRAGSKKRPRIPAGQRHVHHAVSLDEPDFRIPGRVQEVTRPDLTDVQIWRSIAV